MESVLSNKVLVLNKSWQAIDMITVKEAISKVFANTAKVVGRDYSLYSFEEWVDNWSDAAMYQEMSDRQTIKGDDFQIPIPEVIVNNFKGFRRNTCRFSRRNLFLRDDHSCQYCGYHSEDRRKFNLDHVIPKSRGGLMTWDNIVLSCVKCNSKKGNRTPEEASMTLKSKPYKPTWSQIRGKIGNNIPEFWKSFIDVAYWNVELKD